MSHHGPVTPESETRPSTLVAALAGVVATVAYASVALLQILVWNPEAAVPGSAAADVWRAVGEANQGPPNAFVVGVIAMGPLLAVVLLVVYTVTGSGFWNTVAGYLGLLVAGLPGYFVASFGPGMGLADTYGISGGDFAPGGEVLFIVSTMSVIGLVAIFVGAAVRGRLGRIGVPRREIVS